MSNSRRVSIVVATYNRGELLCENAESLLAQEYDNYEVIYVDDGSTDESPTILEALRATHGERLRVVRVENGGAVQYAVADDGLSRLPLRS